MSILVPATLTALADEWDDCCDVIERVCPGDECFLSEAKAMRTCVKELREFIATRPNQLVGETKP